MGIEIPTMKRVGKQDVKPSAPIVQKTAEAAEAIPEVIDFSKVEIEPLFEGTVDFDTFSKSDFRAVKVKECVAVPKSKKLLQFTLDDGTGTETDFLRIFSINKNKICPPSKAGNGTRLTMPTLMLK